MSRTKHFVLGFCALGLWLFVGTAAATAQSTTSTPGQTKVGADYFLVPKGGYTIGAGQMGFSVDYEYGLVMGGQDGPKIGGGQIANLNGGMWQGTNITAAVGQKYWVKSRLNYAPPLGSKTPWVRGEHTIVME